MRQEGGGGTPEETCGVIALAAASHQKDTITLAEYTSLSSWARRWTHGGKRAATADTRSCLPGLQLICTSIEA